MALAVGAAAPEPQYGIGTRGYPGSISTSTDVALSLLLSTHPCAPLTSLPTFLLTTSPSPAPLTSVRWPDSNAQAAAGSVP